MLLIFSVLWLRNFSIAAEKTITVRFRDTGPISQGLPVYYQGLNVGRIKEIKYSDDYKYTLAVVEIHKKNLNLPQNVYAETRTEGITGQKYLALVYPEQPSYNTLQDGDIIEGRLSAMQEVQANIGESLRNGKIQNAVGDVRVTALNAAEASQKINDLIVIIEQIILDNRPEINKILKNALYFQLL